MKPSKEKKQRSPRGSVKIPKVQTAPVLPGPPPPGSALVPVSPPLAAERALQERQSKQKWSSKHLPKRKKMRDTVSVIMAMKIQGHSTTEIAETLKIKPASVRQYMFIAGREGWLDSRDPHEIAHSQLVHRAVTNLEEWLTARDGRTGLPDKEVTLESLKGLGIFHAQGGSASQPEAQQTNVLAIQITMPQNTATLPKMREGNDGGNPAYTDGEVISVTSQSRRQLSE